jgi:hypothetical protein
LCTLSANLLGAFDITWGLFENVVLGGIAVEERQIIAPAATQRPLKAHRGGAVLTLGILGLVVCFILGVIAWVMANSDLRQMDLGVMDPAGRSMTQAGKICGIVSVVLAFVPLCIGLLALLVVIITAVAANL